MLLPCFVSGGGRGDLKRCVVVTVFVSGGGRGDLRKCVVVTVFCLWRRTWRSEEMCCCYRVLSLAEDVAI